MPREKLSSIAGNYSTLVTSDANLGIYAAEQPTCSANGATSCFVGNASYPATYNPTNTVRAGRGRGRGRQG